METVRLDGRLLRERGEAMGLLGQALALPEWWGRNLDALYDCLTEPGEPRLLVLVDRAAVEGTPFGRRLLRVLEDAAGENPSLWIEEDGGGDGGADGGENRG